MTNGYASQPQAPRSAAPATVFSDVLCAIDGKDGGFAAVEQAAALAGPQAHVTLLGVTSHRVEGELRSPAIGPLKMKEILDRALQIARTASVATSREVDPASPPAKVVMDWSAGRDLLALGAPGNSWIGGMFIAGVGDTALGHLRTPVLVARPNAARRRVGERILVASDALEGSDEVVALAARLAAAHGAEVVLLHAAPHAHSPHRRHADEQERRLELQRRALEGAAAGAVEARAARGSAHELIAQAARELQASLVVLGSRRLGGVRAIGSVSRRVVHETGCSVLLVPPGGRRMPREL